MDINRYHPIMMSIHHGLSFFVKTIHTEQQHEIVSKILKKFQNPPIFGSQIIIVLYVENIFLIQFFEREKFSKHSSLVQ